MLVAITSIGKTFSLAATTHSKEELMTLRKKEKFCCPVCEQEVILKLGTKQAWHFSHRKKDTCTFEGEAETAYHIQGKKLLYHWLKRQELTVELEPYLKPIKQRPDLLIKTAEKTYALEYQCSKISPELFIKRTKSYVNSNYSPVWILGENQLKRRNETTFCLTGFQWLFAFQSLEKKLHPQLIFFCPTTRLFLLLKNVTALSATRSAAFLETVQLHKTSFQSLFRDNTIVFQERGWNITKKKWRYQRFRLSQGENYLQALYVQKNHPLWLFPAEAGIPVKFHQFIETPTYIWQSWLLELFIIDREKGFKFHRNLPKRAFQTLLNKGIFKLRQLPLFTEGDHLQAIDRYLFFLGCLGVISTENGEIFEKRKTITYPKDFQQGEFRDRQIMAYYCSMII